VSQAGATNNQLVWVTQHSCTILNKGRTMKAVVLLVAMFHGGSADLTGERQGDVCGEEAPQTNVDVSLLQSRKSFQLSNKKSLLVEDDASVHSCVQQKFAQIVRETRTPARAVLRVERAGSVLYEETADSSGSTRSGAASFEIMSLTKPLVGSVIQQLMDEGKLWYLDKFTLYMPSSINTAGWCGSGDINTVRVVDLLRHTSGFKDYWNNEVDETYTPRGGTTVFEQDWTARGRDKFWTPEEVLSYMPVMNNLCSDKRYSYADTNFMILGKMIEHMEEKPLHQVIRIRILNKVGMSHTFMLHRETRDGTSLSTTSTCNVRNTHWVGDGWCDPDGGYNTPECSYDGGDCCPQTCTAGRKYPCGQRGVRYRCVLPVDSGFYNGRLGITTGQRRFSADWGGSGYVSTGEDLAKFIRTWAVSPQMLFCIPTSNCRVTSYEMTTKVTTDEYYGSGFETLKPGGQWAFGHSGYSNSFMFYVEKTGVTITGTINDKKESESEMRFWTLLDNLVTSCVGNQASVNPPYIPCPGNDGDEYMKKPSWEDGGSCDRACKAWQWADHWPHRQCMNKCNQDGDWDDQYVTCLQRNYHCKNNPSAISQNKCEVESPGCFAVCSASQEAWWKCIPRCEGGSTGPL